jgi:hypothetical protein
LKTALTVVIGSEHALADLQPFSLVASTQRWTPHGHGRRHRTDAHALSARHFSRR